MCRYPMPTDPVAVQVPINGISEYGQVTVKNFLFHHTGGLELPDDWSWDWKVNGKGEYVGTFPKRVAKWVYQNSPTHQKLTPEEMSAIGDLASRYVFRQSEFLLDFTHDFDWRAGDFGDNDSCFWGGRERARHAMEDSGRVAAVRFYKEMSYGGKTGYARAWVADVNRIKDGVVVFNAYGLDTLVIARILAQFWGVYYRSTRLENQESCDGTLWINGDGAGYLLGSHESLATLPADTCVELGIDCSASCQNCEETIPDGDDERHGPGGEVLCSTCYDETSSCRHCGDRCWDDDMSIVNDDRYCSGCYDALFTDCSECGEAFPNDDLEDDLCSGCHSEAYARCDECNDEFPNDDLEDDLCSGCHSEAYARCDECNDEFPNDDLEDGLCDNCCTDRENADATETTVTVDVSGEEVASC